MINIRFAQEVGILKFLYRKLLWKTLKPAQIKLHNGQVFPLPSFSDFASDVFVTGGNVDWNAEYILFKYLTECGEGGVFVDVGTNIGYYSVLLAQSVDTVYSFEPDERNWASIENLSSLGQIILVKSPVADKSRKVSLKKEAASDVSCINLDDEDADMETIALDEYFNDKEGSVRAVKVDIEGFDVLVLEGAKKLANTQQPVFLVEFNIEKGKPNSYERLGDFCAEVGYSLFTISRTLNGNKWVYQFSQVSIEALPSLNYKMLFLVSPKSKSWFKSLEAKYDSFRNEGVGKNAVERLLKMSL